MRWTVLLLITLVGACIGYPRAATTTYYAAPSGSGSCRNNSASNPIGGLKAEIACLGSGDTLQVADGTYHNDQINMATIPNGSSNSSRTQITATRKAILTSSTGPSCVWLHSGRSFITITGFTCDHVNDPRGSGGLDFADRSNSTHDILITGMEIANFTGDTTYQEHFITLAGIGAAYIVANVAMDNLYVHDIGLGQTPGCCNNAAYGYGIYLSGQGYTVQNSLFQNITGFGVHGYCGGSGPGCATKNIIRGNTFINTGSVYGAGPGWQIVNNVIVHVGYGFAAPAPGAQAIGISVGRYGPADAGGDLIANNSVFHARGACMEVGYTRSGTATIQNNICYKSGSDGIQNVGNASIAESHNLFGTDPHWVNPDGGDLHLQSGSPALDVGTTLPSTSPDKDGAARPQGKRYAIGAYEGGGKEQRKISDEVPNLWIK